MADSSPVITHLLLERSATEMSVKFNARNMRGFTFQLIEATSDAALVSGHRRHKMFEMEFVKGSIFRPVFSWFALAVANNIQRNELDLSSNFVSTHRSSRTVVRESVLRMLPS
jgi:hypothetical protein